MLSIFPDLLIYGIFAPTIIRIVVGLTIFYLGIYILFVKKDLLINKLMEKKYPFANFYVWPIGIISLISGGFLILGFITQISAIISAFLFLKFAIIDSDDKKVIGQSWLFYFVMIFVTLSLVISGAGIFAIDMPF